MWNRTGTRRSEPDSPGPRRPPEDSPPSRTESTARGMRGLPPHVCDNLTAIRHGQSAAPQRHPTGYLSQGGFPQRGSPRQMLVASVLYNTAQQGRIRTSAGGAPFHIGQTPAGRGAPALGTGPSRRQGAQRRHGYLARRAALTRAPPRPPV